MCRSHREATEAQGTLLYQGLAGLGGSREREGPESEVTGLCWRRERSEAEGWFLLFCSVMFASVIDRGARVATPAQGLASLRLRHGSQVCLWVS